MIDMKDLMPILIQIVLIPILTALTGVAVKWINSKANEIKTKTDNIYLRQCIDILNDTITSAVVAVNQTYVNELKTSGEFTKEAQEKAFAKVYDAVIATLTDEAKTCLNVALGDLDVYIQNRIEESVAQEKIETPEFEEEEIETDVDEDMEIEEDE